VEEFMTQSGLSFTKSNYSKLSFLRDLVGQHPDFSYRLS
jgi:hypothetical protein